MISSAATIDQNLKQIFKSSPKSVFITSANPSTQWLSRISNQLAANNRSNKLDTLILRHTNSVETFSFNAMLDSFKNEILENLTLDTFGLTDLCHLIHLQSRSTQLHLVSTDDKVHVLYFWDGVLFQIAQPDNSLIRANTPIQDHNKFLLKSTVAQLSKLNIKSYSFQPLRSKPDKSFKLFLANQKDHYALTDLHLDETHHFISTLKQHLMSNADGGKVMQYHQTKSSDKSVLRLFNIISGAFDKVILESTNPKSQLIRRCHTCVVVVQHGDRVRPARKHIKRILKHNIPVAGTVFIENENHTHEQTS